MALTRLRALAISIWDAGTSITVCHLRRLLRRFAVHFPSTHVLRLPSQRWTDFNRTPHLFRCIQKAWIDDAVLQYAMQKCFFSVSELEQRRECCTTIRRDGLNPNVWAAERVKVTVTQTRDQFVRDIAPIATDHFRRGRSPVESPGTRANHQGCELNLRPVQAGQTDDPMRIEKVGGRRG